MSGLANVIEMRECSPMVARISQLHNVQYSGLVNSILVLSNGRVILLGYPAGDF